MKLYQTSEGVWFRPGTINPKSATRVDIPGDSEGLVHFLNDYRRELLGGGQQPIFDTPEEYLAAQSPKVVPLRPADFDSANPDKAARADEIVAFILDEAAVHHVENIMAALGTRVGELVKASRNGVA